METRVLSGVKLSQRAWLGKYLTAEAWTGHSLRTGNQVVWAGRLPGQRSMSPMSTGCRRRMTTRSRIPWSHMAAPGRGLRGGM